MFAKTLIAAATVASVVAFAATSAKANPSISLGIGFGFGGYDSGYYGGGYDDGYNGEWHPHHQHHWDEWQEPQPVDDYAGISCSEGRNIVREAGFQHVSAYNCSASVFSYRGWKYGTPYQVRVDSQGDVVSERPLY